MIAHRGFVCAGAALGLSVLTGGALAQDARAQESWPSYAPRCQTAELAADPTLRDPCAGQVAIFGPKGTMVLSRGQGVDIETTGSIGKAPRSERDSRTKL